MSLDIIGYLVGMLVMFAARRLLDGQDTPQLVVTLVAMAILAVSAASRVRRMRKAKSDGLVYGHRVALVFTLVGLASLVLYAGTTDWVLDNLTLGDEARGRWLGVLGSAWPLVWLLGTVPLLVVDWAVESSPQLMPRQRVRDLAGHGLVVAMAIGIVFPINFIASETNERWDLAYFKTVEPGTATEAIVESLETPVTVRVFMPPSSEVAQELRDYFAPLEGPNLSLQIIDQAAEPRLAKALSVRDNGVVAFTGGEVELDPAPEGDEESEEKKPKPVTRTLRVDEDIEKAKRMLKKLDQEVQRILIEIGHGERIAYVTTGHGELDWSGGRPQQLTPDGMYVLREVMKARGFSVKRLGAQQGLGEEIPEDADVVLVLGPKTPFATAEVDALRRYVQGGGSILLALDPQLAKDPGMRMLPDPLDDLVAELGIERKDGVLAAETGHKRATGGIQDRLLIQTSAFTSHPSIRTLSANSATDSLFTPMSSHLGEVPESETDITFVARSPATAWADLNRNLEFDHDAGETKEARPVVAAIEGGGEGTRWRALVTSGSGMLSDLGAAVSRGNSLFVTDSLNWLIGAEALSGTTESEEDVKIEHTKEGQAIWFYLTVLGVPLAVVVLGSLRIRLRHAGMQAKASARGGQR